VITRTIIATLAIGGMLAITGCSAMPPTSSPNPQLQGTWHLVLATDRSGTIPAGAEEITLTIGDSNHTGGASPCSQYHATITGGIGAVFVDASFAGRNIRCNDPALAKIDNQYIDALAASSVASLDDGLLVLSSPHTSLVYIKPSASSTGTLQNSRWSLVEPPDLRERTAVYLTFGNVNQLTIITSCSLTVAHYVLVEDIIILRGTNATTIGSHPCTPTDRVAQAVLTGQLTADVSSATISGPATLILTNRANEQPLLWRAT
jgi:heat shock protein HslJ